MARGATGRGSAGSHGGFGRGSVRTFNTFCRGRGAPRKSKEERAKLVCEHCGYNSHEMKECFKLNGYPDWYKEFKEQRRNNHSVNMLEGSAVESTQSKLQGEAEPKKSEVPNFAAMIQKEIARYLSGQPITTSGDIHSFSHVVDYSGTMLNSHFAMSLIHTLGKLSWTVDNGASRHICSYPDLIDKPTLMPSPVTVHFPDGTSVVVTHSGSLKLTHEITINDTLRQQRKALHIILAATTWRCRSRRPALCGQLAAFVALCFAGAVRAELSSCYILL
ncbi:hypothetical protein DH2020_047339 [Rehmannia glutinosa]|uniref:Uncharacterized protein n=1 Tax=Rehmannia glutinosa TaxID=99300 RepID=A0ABR0U9E5_REHGL